jgi:hypothetical protein
MKKSSRDKLIEIISKQRYVFREPTKYKRSNLPTSPLPSLNADPAINQVQKPIESTMEPKKT